MDPHAYLHAIGVAFADSGCDTYQSNHYDPGAITIISAIHVQGNAQGRITPRLSQASRALAEFNSATLRPLLEPQIMAHHMPLYSVHVIQVPTWPLWLLFFVTLRSWK
jgi:hypothetical protein